MPTSPSLAQKQYRAVAHSVQAYQPPFVARLAAERRPAYHLLIAIMLSLRTRDSNTERATTALLKIAPNIQRLRTTSIARIASAIVGCNYYRTKAHTLHRLAVAICANYGGTIPNCQHALLSLPGIGIKTANLLLSSAFGIDAICVDTHVHRIANRTGWVTTTDPAHTERTLRHLFPVSAWSSINDTLVRHGMHLCTPRSPHCSRCPIADSCQRHGVTKWR